MFRAHGSQSYTFFYPNGLKSVVTISVDAMHLISIIILEKNVSKISLFNRTFYI